jgi:hypothetical protein
MLCAGERNDKVHPIHNGIVSITAGAWEARQVAECEILNGCIRIATGAPDLAFKTGAALLPVFSYKEDGDDNYKVVVDGPIETGTFTNRTDAIKHAVNVNFKETEKYVKKYPDQWRSRSKIFTP